MYHQAITQLKKLLGQLDNWLGAARVYAEDRKFDPSVLVMARLAPDQWALGRQIQGACDSATNAAARLAGTTDETWLNKTETTLDGLSAQVRSTIGYLDRFSANDFEAAATSKQTPSYWYERPMPASDFLLQDALPNFYFHLAHAYAILRHNGVRLDKFDYIGALTPPAE